MTRYLVETFSQVRDFDPYIGFMENAKTWAERATDNAMKSDRNNKREAERLRNLISLEERAVGERMAERECCQSEAVNYKTMLENLEQSREASALLVNTNNRLANLETQKRELFGQIKENYTFRLLDEMWILLGFEPIAHEFQDLISEIDIQRRKEQSRHDREIGAKKMASKMQEELNQGFVPLALNVPDEKTMREMLNEEVCKVCGTKAPKGSIPYINMKKHLDDYLASLRVVDEEDETKEPPLYKYDFVSQLTARYSVMHNNMKFITNLNPFIERAIQTNIKLHEKISKIDANIEQEVETKKKILAQTEGLSEDQLLSNYQNINEWWRLRTTAEKRKEALDKEIESHQTVLDQYREDYSAIAEESAAAMYSRSSTAIRKILDAFLAAKNKNRRDFLNSLEREANIYLANLNKGDFRGKVKIDEKSDISADVYLADNDGTRIYNPNTALKTTMYMSGSPEKVCGLSVDLC